MDKPIGSVWLRNRYKLRNYNITHCSYLGTRSKGEIDEHANTIEFYAPHYAPNETAIAHIEFALKYDDLNLDFLRTVFNLISLDEIVHYIQLKPNGSYERRIGFLYEFLTGKTIPVDDTGKGNYIDLIDASKYITGNSIKNKRWNINNNLLGSVEFCPVIRKTRMLESLLQTDYKVLVEEITRSYPLEVYHRAVNYLFTKETRSSYQIEHEKPTPERVARFVRFLEKAGEQTIEELLNEKNLTSLQGAIVDPRFAADGYRNFQNYIGQTTYNYKQLIHYVCPPPEIVHSMMNGLQKTAEKTAGSYPVVRAAIIAFGFVFIHPFEDGNGRLHRFLIHDILVRDQIVRKGMIIPVSAHMVNHISDYDKVLENYSIPLMERMQYEMKDDQSVIVMNLEEVEGYFRYPDLTAQCIYLAQTIKDTITEDIYWEMEFLMKYDEIKLSAQEIVDMPDRDMDLLIKLLHQNKGELSSRKRKLFEKLTDQEISQIETVFRKIFNIL